MRILANFSGILIRLPVLLVSLVISSVAFGQDSLILPTITINEHYLPFSTTFLNDSDSSMMSAKYFMDTGSFLDKRTPVYIRKYGPGLSYSLSVRGSNSAQVNILWNDVPINSPMQGQADLALLNYTEDVLIKFDPNTYAYGLSGALSIDGINHAKKGFYYSLTETLTSTFGHRTSLFGRYSNGKLYSSASAGIINELNSFRYLKNDQKLSLENNGIDNYQGKINLGFKIKNKHRIAFNSWFLHSTRLIPPSLYEQSSDASQLDKWIKFNGSYQFINESFAVKLNLAILDDHLIYSAPGKNLFTESRSISFVESLDLNWVFSTDHHLKMQLLNKQMKVISNAYNHSKRIDELNLILQYKLRLASKHKFQTGIRAGTRFNNNYKLAPFLYYNFKLTDNFGLLFATGKKFRYPAFNDLFWYQGGNQELLPELASETELGFNWKIIKGLKFTTRNYYKKVDNWILWIPENGVFSARNIEKVLGFGSENSLSLAYRTTRYHWTGNMIYQFSRMMDESRNNAKSQLIYTPVHLLKTNYTISFNSWQIGCEANFTGKVYTNQDNSSFLPHYSIINANIEKRWKINKLEITNWIRINNLLSKRYFSIENYVMPGRTIEIGAKLQPSLN